MTGRSAFIVMLGSMYGCLQNGVGHGGDLSEGSYKCISWFEMMKSKSEMMKSWFAISNSSHELFLFAICINLNITTALL